jgi:RNA polymerase sigma factor (TIGR02999 family)
VSGAHDEPSDGAITETLRAWERGDDRALEALLPMVYAELRQIAARHISSERSALTLQPTALAHEAYLKLREVEGVAWQSRTHFFALASRIMRRVLVDRARARSTRKRGADAPKVELREGLNDDAASGAPRVDPIDLIDLDRALDELARLEPRLAKLVEVRYFGGLSIEEAAEVTGTSGRTAKRDWTFARAWLLRRLAGPDATAPVA